jgi:hypothetical protein
MPPRICFERWGEIPGDDPDALPGSQGDGKYLQTGFHLVNDEAAAYDIKVESFEIEPSLTAMSKTISRIVAKGRGFALVWLNNNEKWDLAGSMAKACEAKFGSSNYNPGYSIPVSVVYQDADRVRYRTRQLLTFVRSQGQLVFGPPTFERITEATADIVSAAPGSGMEERAKRRSDWLDQKLAQHPTWTSDNDIAANGGPSYNTIQRFRSGATSTRELFVRKQLAKAFNCDIEDVPS